MFVGVVTLIIYTKNQSLKKQYANIVDALGERIIIHLEHVKCETFSSGAKNGGYYFSQCDLYVTENALVILGYSRVLSFKQLSVPLVLTTDSSFHFVRFPYARLIKPKKINLNSFNGDIYIEFESPGFIKTNVEIRLQGISDQVKNKLEFLNTI